jgi:hypothetical protein
MPRTTYVQAAIRAAVKSGYSLKHIAECAGLPFGEVVDIEAGLGGTLKQKQLVVQTLEDMCKLDGKPPLEIGGTVGDPRHVEPEVEEPIVVPNREIEMPDWEEFNQKHLDKVQEIATPKPTDPLAQFALLCHKVYDRAWFGKKVDGATVNDSRFVRRGLDRYGWNLSSFYMHSTPTERKTILQVLA